MRDRVKACGPIVGKTGTGPGVIAETSVKSSVNVQKL